MEFSKAQIAALVLGYLKSEKLGTVVDKFLETCPYFEEKNVGIRNGKYFVTRVAGLRLVDFLEQYAVIYTIVHGRLEESNYYDFYTNSNATLVEKILYLLDKESPACRTSTPERSATSEVEATPEHTLPGNISTEDAAISKTPKRNTSLCRSKDKDEVFDVSEILTPFLENRELHEKIAETINIVRNTPEVGKNVTDEHISAGASKELDAVIKTVLQKTEEDPVYNKLIDEIVGTVPCENVPAKKSAPCNLLTETSPSSNADDVSKNDANDIHQSNNVNNTIIDVHNDDAVRSIIEASQNTTPLPVPAPSNSLRNDNGEVYVFDGTLDTYLKSSGATNAISQNHVYINPGGLIVMPPAEGPKQFYIVNNQPLINMNVKGPMLTEKEIMSIPTIIVNDPSTSPQAVTAAPNTYKKPIRRNKLIKAKPPSEPTGLLMTTPKLSENTKKPKVEMVVVTASETTLPLGEILPKTTPSTQTTLSTTQTTPSATRCASHIRNLDFSTPASKDPPKKGSKTWDEDLRILVSGCKDKSPLPKKKRVVTGKKKKTKVKNDVPDDCQKKDKLNEEQVLSVVAEEKEKAASQTPVKDLIPKTPGGSLVSGNNSFHCTPFNEVLEKQLEGVDLSTIPTPSIPITPGFALTPGDLISYNQRSTDYSTSSSYYQPSDTEQNRSIDQLIEECKRLENSPPPQDKFTNLKILSDVVIEHGQKPANESEKNESKTNGNSHVKTVGGGVIAKKNLNLIKRQPATSSSSDSESDSESSELTSNRTVICKTDTTTSTSDNICDIINKVEVKNTLEKETRTKHLLSHLEEVRQRTIQKIKNPEVSKKPPVRNSRKKAPIKPTKVDSKKNPKKKETSPIQSVDEQKQKLVTDLAQRGIHLVPNKSQHKNKTIKETTPTMELNSLEESIPVFENKFFDDFETVVYGPKTKRRELSSYNFDVLKKSMSIKVFDEDLNEEVTSILKWTNFDMIFELQPKKAKKSDQEIEDDLMDYVFMEAAKGGKKRKLKNSEDEGKQVEKKTKTLENNLKLLKKIDVDIFLDKVHGE